MKEQIGNRIKSARKLAGFSLRELADLLNGIVSHNAISKYEKGLMMPDSKVLIALSKALNVKTDFFFRVDTWLNNKYDDNTAISSTEDYAFQAQATNVRGFPINIRNGTSNIVLNSEIRWPIFSFLANKPIKSAFLKNFQFIGFFDIGSAYNGLTPFNEKNPYINQQVTPNGNQTPVVVEANYYRNPTVMGTGAGFRTTLLGYFLRVDLAWGIDGGLVNKKPMWLFSFSKDF
jgi:transcriptional regulator with XRE-family HTH domain